jgi:hypothetical protein
LSEGIRTMPRSRWTRVLDVELLEARTLLNGQAALMGFLREAEPNDTPATAQNIERTSQTTGAVTSQDADFFRLVLTAAGRLTARAEAVGVNTRLSLLDGQGRLLIQSEGESPGHPDDRIAQHLDGTDAGTTYFLQVEALGGGTGTYRLTTEFQRALPPFGPLSVEEGSVPAALLTADFNGDGHLDLASANGNSRNVSLLLGLGDGTFEPEAVLGVDETPAALVAGDFDRDGRLDLATAGGDAGTVSILLGAGDGTFPRRKSASVGAPPTALVTGDFDGDGRPDLAVAHQRSRDESIQPGVLLLFGQGDGTLPDHKRVELEADPLALVAGDFNRDGRLDFTVAVTRPAQPKDTLEVFLGQGGREFRHHGQLRVGKSPQALVRDQFNDDNGDGRIDDRDTLDLAVANFLTPEDAVHLFLGVGNGSFVVPEQPVKLVGKPQALVAADFNGDGRLDLATANEISRDLSILLGVGDGTLQAERRLAKGGRPRRLATGDFNGDGRPDLAVADQESSDLTVLLGVGNGTFQSPERFPVGDDPRGLAVGDFNGDGRLDLVTANQGSADVAVLLGLGDGTFQNQRRFAVGEPSRPGTAGGSNGDGQLPPPPIQPLAVAVGDFNGDGRQDLVVANQGSRNAAVLLGRGDGTFREPRLLPVENPALAVVAGDFNGDGRDDFVLGLRTAQEETDQVAVFLGQGGGEFRRLGRFGVGKEPVAVVAGQLTDDNGDGRIDNRDFLDLVTANINSDDVSVLLGKGDGTFRRQKRIALRGPEEPAPEPGDLSNAPIALVLGDFDGDKLLDLATANIRSRDVSVLLGRGGAAFRRQEQGPRLGSIPTALVAGDLDGDGRLDLAAGDRTHRVVLWRGLGDGTFQRQPEQPRVGEIPRALVARDFDGDGRLDLATANFRSGDVSVLQRLGDGAFVAAGSISNTVRATPLWQDVNGDETPDVTLLSRDGEIRLHLGQPRTPGAFEAPLTVNADAQLVFDPNLAARDVAMVSIPQGTLLAALDAKRPAVSLYARQPNGTWARSAGLVVPGTLPVRIAAADLNGDGRGDLVVLAAGTGEVFVYYQNAAGGFRLDRGRPLSVGTSPSDLVLVDVDQDGRLDIVVANQFSGDVSVLANRAALPFARELRFRAGTGLYGVEQLNQDRVIRSREGTVGIVALSADADNVLDLVVTNSRTGRFALLRGTGSGGFLNPESPADFATGPRPTVIVTGLFNGDAHADLALVKEGSQDLSIFLGNGRGGFDENVRLRAGEAPTGLTAAQVTDDNGDGRIDARDQVDLLVGNEFGDVLLLRNVGDGTFEAFRPGNRNITLAVARLDGDAKDDFILANEFRDRLLVQLGDTQPRPILSRADGLRTPRAVGVADLNKDGHKDLVVLNSGDNSVLVFLGTPDGGFDRANPIRHATGTNPAAVTIQDLKDNDSGLDDLVVANEGSNDVTILLGTQTRTGWELTPGPRLRAGRGPVATTVRDVSGPDRVPDGTPDLLVSNSRSDNVSLLLLGLRDGFFDDRTPEFRSVGSGPGQVLPLGTGIATINPSSDTVTFLPNFLQSRPSNSPSGGDRPVAALAGRFNDDTFFDLLVAHNGDGRISLLLGLADDTLDLKGARPSSFLNPTALVRGAEPDTIYLAGEDSGDGTEAVRPLSVAQLLVDLLTPIIPPPIITNPPTVTALVPLSDTGLALIAILVTGGVDTGTDLAPESAEPPAAQGLPALTDDPEGGEEGEPALTEDSGTDGEGEAATDAELPAPGSAEAIRHELRVGLEEAEARQRPLTPEELLDGSEDPMAVPRQPGAGEARSEDTVLHALYQAGLAVANEIGRWLRWPLAGSDGPTAPVQADGVEVPEPGAEMPRDESAGGGAGALSRLSTSALVLCGVCQGPRRTGRTAGLPAHTKQRIGKGRGGRGRA